MNEPTPTDLRKFAVAVLSWIGPLLQARQATAVATVKDASSDGWETERMVRAKSIVTDVDHEAQALILDRVHEAFPTHGVRFEEDAPAEQIARFPTDAEYVWLVDPIDGTMNYADGSPNYGAILGVAHVPTGQVIAGALIEPETGRVFSFAKGTGAFLGREPYTIRGPKAGAPVLCGSQVPDGLTADLEAEGRAWRRAYFCVVTATVRLLTGEGAAIVFNNSDSLDVTVPFAIVAAARGKVSTWDGRPVADWLAPRIPTMLVAGDPVLFEELLEITGPYEPAP